MHFRNLTRHAGIGANSYLLTLGTSQILLDAGLDPNITGSDALPAFEFLAPGTLDDVILTHSHLDHTGALPVVFRQHPCARFLATEPTRDLTDVLMHNSVNVMTAQRDELGVLEYPLFTHREVNELTARFETRPVRRPFPIGKPADSITCEFFEAGHILGSVGVLIRYRDQSIFYTGDVQFEDQNLSRAAVFPDHPLDTVISETTRGADARPPAYTRAEEIAALGRAIRETIARGGSVLIPVFANGKTQETLLILDQLKKDGAIPAEVPLFIGGLSTKMTIIYDRHADTAHRQRNGFRILEEMDLGFASSGPGRGRGGRRKSGRGGIPYRKGAIYALSSGMMTENTLSNRFAARVLPAARDAILFVGYAAPDSPAGIIQAAAPGSQLAVETGGPLLTRACQVERFDFSGHATRDALREFIRGANPARVFLVHGDREATGWVSSALRADLPSAEISIPAAGESLPLGSVKVPAGGT